MVGFLPRITTKNALQGGGGRQTKGENRTESRLKKLRMCVGQNCVGLQLKLRLKKRGESTESVEQKDDRRDGQWRGHMSHHAGRARWIDRVINRRHRVESLSGLLHSFALPSSTSYFLQTGNLIGLYSVCAA